MDEIIHFLLNIVVVFIDNFHSAMEFLVSLDEDFEHPAVG
jgi:hypothetical protein